MKRLATRWLALLLLCGSVAIAQDIDLPSAQYERLTGLYEFEDGRLAVIFDLVDQLGRNQLTVVEPGSGRVRTIYPQSPIIFEAGSAWFVEDPKTYALHFEQNADSLITGLQWSENDTTRYGRRVQFDEREVTFTNGDVTLAGTLVLPEEGEGPFPGMVMIHGSGPLTRRTQRYVADLFAHQGIAVLVHDKRGTGGSSGQWNGLAHEEWAGDIQAALALLRTQPEIDSTRVGLFAASEGGYVAPLVVADDPDLVFLICRVCAGIPHGTVILDMEAGNMRRNGYSDEEVEAATAYLAKQIDFALTREDWGELETLYHQSEGAQWMQDYNITLHESDAAYWDYYAGVLKVNSQDYYAHFQIPILILLGERDNRILVDKNRSAYEAARAASGNPNFDIWVLPNASHGLMVVSATTNGQPGPIDRFVPGFHIQMVEWAKKQVMQP